MMVCDGFMYPVFSLGDVLLRLKLCFQSCDDDMTGIQLSLCSLLEEGPVTVSGVRDAA